MIVLDPDFDPADCSDLITIELRKMDESTDPDADFGSRFRRGINTGPENTGRQNSPICSPLRNDNRPIGAVYDATCMTLGSKRAVSDLQKYLNQNGSQVKPFFSFNEVVATSIELSEDGIYKWANNIKNKFWGAKEDFVEEAKQLGEQLREQGYLKKRLKILKNLKNPGKSLIMEGIALKDQLQKQAQATDDGLHDFKLLLDCIAESPTDIPKIVEKFNSNCVGLPKDGLGRFTYFSTGILCTLFAYKGLKTVGTTAKELAYWVGASNPALSGAINIVESTAVSSSAAPSAGGVVASITDINKLFEVLQMKIAFGSLLPKKVSSEISGKKPATPREPGASLQETNGVQHPSVIEKILENPNLTPEAKESLENLSLGKDFATSIAEASASGVSEQIIIQDFKNAYQYSITKGRPEKAFNNFNNLLDQRKFYTQVNVTERSKEFALGKCMPIQIHHGIPHNNSKYSPDYKDQMENKGINLDLNGDWNKFPCPHLGRHAKEYFDTVVSEQLDEILTDIQFGDIDRFLELYNEKIKDRVQSDFIILYKAGHQ